jgi:tetratricopeptide (TPR) repeat protein
MAPGAARFTLRAGRSMFGKWFGKAGEEPEDIRHLAATFRDLKLDPNLASAVISLISRAPDTEEPWVEAAIELRKLGYERACESTYQVALRRLPRSFRLWGNRGVLLRNESRFDEAVESLQKALSLKGDYAIAVHNLANTYELAQDFPRAIEFYRKAIALDARDARSWNGLANCKAAQGLYEEARVCYDNAIGIDPNYDEPHFNWILQLIRQGKRQEAIGKLHAYLARWPEDTQARQALAMLEDPSNSLPKVHYAEAPERTHMVVRPVENIDYGSGDTKANVKPAAANEAAISFSELGKLSRGEADALGEFGAYDKARLWELVKERVNATTPPDDTRIFLSYRREGPQHMAWMRRLAQELDERGYDVMLDQFVEGLDNPPSVPELISMMASCNVFSPVLTEGYFERIDPGDGLIVSHPYLSDGWAFDEFQVALYLGQMKRLVVTGLWRSGTLRQPFTRDNVVDLRQDGQLTTALDRPFPRRKLMVFGMRSADRGRTIGPLPYSQATEVMRELQQSGEYSRVFIVDAAAMGSRPG